MATIDDLVEMASPAAVLTIKNAGDMTPQGRKDIADWMRKQATLLEQDGGQYAIRFRARYLSREG